MQAGTISSNSASVGMRISSKLALVLTIIVFAVGSALYFSVTKLHSVTHSFIDLEKNEWQVSKLASTWQGHAHAVSARVTASMKMPVGAPRDKFVAEGRQSIEEIAGVIQAIDKLQLKGELSKRVQAVKIARKEFEQVTTRLEGLKLTGEFMAIESLLNEEYEYARIAYLTQIDELRNAANQSAQTSILEAQKDAENSAWMAAVWLGTAIAVAATAAWLLAKSITSPMSGLITRAQAMASGDLSDHPSINSSGEIAELERALSDMRLSLREMVSQVRSSTEMVTHALTVDGEAGIHRSSPDSNASSENDVAAMTKSVHALQDTARTLVAGNWVKNLVVEVSRALAEVNSEKDYAASLVSRLSQAVGAQLGIMYLVNKDRTMLQRAGSYGLAPSNNESADIAMGEGLVGQCAVDGTPRQISPLDADMLRIESGLLSAVPKHLHIIPIIGRENHVLAVIEIASLSTFGVREQALLAELMPTVALQIELLRKQNDSKRLLEEVTVQSMELQQHADVLKWSEEQMRTQRDELATQTEVLQEQKGMLETANAAIAKKSEEVDAARARAEEATATKSMFLANMSHEIRTPMNAIIGLSHLCLRTELTPKQRDYVDKVHKAGSSLLGIINDILDFSKIEAGKLSIEETDFWMEDVLGQVATLVAQKAEEKDLELLIRVSPDTPQGLIGDPLRIGQILTNLISNAIKFTAKGQIKVDIQVLSRTDEGLELQIKVTDTGIGMSAEQMNRLFKAFSQADGTTTRKFGGTGLGLTISKRLVELMGGDISVNSAEGEGSEFTATVWVQASTRQRELRKVALNGMRALVVDDNADARTILSENLSTFGVPVTTADSAEAGLQLLDKDQNATPYQIAFIDWRMPGMDGIEMSRLIHDATNMPSKPKVVIVSSFSLDAFHDEGKKLGVDAFLPKPINASQLWDTIANVMGKDVQSGFAAGKDPETKVWDLNGLRVLLVEDNEINQQIALELLESCNVSVTVVDDGLAAVQALEACTDPLPFDLVLMDLQMPRMDGHAATVHLRKQARFDALPIIAMTAHAMIEEQQRCQEEGMNDHITKPIDPDTLFATLAKWRAQPMHKRRESDKSAAAAPIKTALPPLSIEGIDTAAGLQRVNGNSHLYARVLRQFCDKQVHFVDEVNECLQTADYETAERKAHTVKGLLATIGATALADTLAGLEKDLRGRLETDQITTKLPGLNEALSSLILSIRSALAQVAPAPDPAQISVRPQDTRATMKALTAMLQDSDPEAIDYVQSNAFHLQSALGTNYAKVKQAIEDCEFEMAMELIQVQQAIS